MKAKLVKAFAAAAAFVVSGAFAAPTITAPADYARVSTLPSRFQTYNTASSTYSWQTYASSTKGSAARVELSNTYAASPTPVTLSWSGTSGSCTVTVKRAKDGKQVFSATTSGTSVQFTDPEIGRNYIWTVKNGSATATGHFFTERQFPRIIPRSGGIGNARDLGGYAGTGGKVVKQGMLFRSEHFDYVDSDLGRYEPNCYPKPYWRDTIGIKLEIDLRAKSYVQQYFYPQNEPGVGIDKSGLDFSIPRYHSENENGAGAFPGSLKDGSYSVSGDSTTYTATQKRKAIYNVFRKLANSANYPVLFHCSQGRDRTGTLAYLLNGLLGVERKNLELDWIYTWAFDDEYKLSSWEIDANAYTPLNAFSGSTFADKCAAFIKACYTAAGSTTAQAEADIAAYRNLMLEVPETAAVKPGADPEPGAGDDDFTYVDYYFRRDTGGGTWGSSSGYWYKSTSDSQKWPGGTSPNDYANCYYFWPTASHPYSHPVCGDHQAGKVVYNGTYAATETACGSNTFKPRFVSTGHASGDRAVVEHRAGIADVDNFDLFLDDPFNGNAAVDVWAGAEFRVADFVAKTPAKTFLRFPENNCANARFRAQLSNYTGGDVLTPNTLGWFSGGKSGTTQYLQVNNAQLKFTATGKTSGVAGNLVLEFYLGNVISTATAAMLQITGTLKLNSGSSVYVDAGGKGAGTYKLLTAGTLTDNAGVGSHYTVVNCASGYYGTVVKSGNAVNLVIAKGSAPDTPVDPPVQPDDPPTSPDTPSETAAYYWLNTKSVATLQSTSVWFKNAACSTKWNAYPNSYTAGIYFYPTAASVIAVYDDNIVAKAHALHTRGDVKVCYGTTAFQNDSATPLTVVDVESGTFRGVCQTLTMSGSGNGAISVRAGATARFSQLSGNDRFTLDFPGGAATLVFENEDGNGISTLGALTGGESGVTYPVTVDNALVTFARSGAANGLAGRTAFTFKLGAVNTASTAAMTFAGPLTVASGSTLAVNAGGKAAGTYPLLTATTLTDNANLASGATVTGLASGASASVVKSGNTLNLVITGGSAPQDDPPHPVSPFAKDHTILCYGDSITEGARSSTETLDSRANFMNGRLAGVSKAVCYPYLLAGLVPSSYNVIPQALGGQKTRCIGNWMGLTTLKTTGAVSLPAAAGTKVTLPGLWYKDQYNATTNYYGGFPAQPLEAVYNEDNYGTLEGTLGGVHVRLSGNDTDGYQVARTESGSAVTLPVNSQFVPDNAAYTDSSIHVFMAGVNDGSANYQDYLAFQNMLLSNLPSGKYVVLTPTSNVTVNNTESNQHSTSTNNFQIEQQFINTFGNHCINLRASLVARGMQIARDLGYYTDAYIQQHSWYEQGTGLYSEGEKWHTHFNKVGYHVIAYLVKEKLQALGYIPSDEPGGRIAGPRSWTGAAGDSMWATDGNWSPLGAPLATEDVTMFADGQGYTFTNSAALPTGTRTMTFTAKNGAYLYTNDKKTSFDQAGITLNLNAIGGSIAFGNSGNNFSKGVLHAVVDEECSIKFNIFNDGTAGSTITTCGRFYTGYQMTLGTSATAIRFEGANSWVYSAGNGGLTVKASLQTTIVAEPTRPSDKPYFAATGSGGTISVAAIPVTVDVSKFANQNGTFTYLLVSGNSAASGTVNLPTLTLTGTGSANCTASVAKSGSRDVILTIVSNNEQQDDPEPPAVDGLVNHFEFNDSANLLKATIGPDAKVGSGTGSSFQLLTNLGGCTAVAGEGRTDGQGAIAIPMGNFLAITQRVGSDVSKPYCMVLKCMAPAITSYLAPYSLDQTNGVDACLFVKQKGLGIGSTRWGGYAGEFTLNTWHQLVISYSGTTTELYFDGDLTTPLRSHDENGDITESLAGRPLVLISADDNGEDELLYFDEIRIYDSARPSAIFGGDEPPVVVTGPEQFDWLDMDGLGYFITDVHPNVKNSELEVTFRLDNAGRNTSLYTATGKTASLSDYGNSLNFDWSYSDGEVDMYYTAEHARPVCAFGTAKHTVVCRGASVTIDGATTTGSGTAPDGATAGPLWIGATCYGNGPVNIADMKLYGFKIATNGVVEHDYYACTNAQGQATLYDRVTGGYLTPVNGSAFTVGNDGDEPPAGGIWADKRIAVMGDSYSDCTGYSAYGHAIYPDAATFGVATWEDMWWAQAINALGGTLCANNSDAGSYVTLDTETRDSFLTRLDMSADPLASPDVILFLGGLNDCWNGVKPADFLTGLKTCFTKLNELYPDAEKYCLVPALDPLAGYVCGSVYSSSRSFWALSADYRNVLKDAAVAYGFKVVDLDGAYNRSTVVGDPDRPNAEWCHPVKQGMTAIAARLQSVANAVADSTYAAPAHVHVFGDEWEETAAATASATGVKQQLCLCPTAANGVCPGYGTVELRTPTTRYEAVEYIEATGAQYLDTGITAQPHLAYTFDFEYTVLVTGQQLFPGIPLATTAVAGQRYGLDGWQSDSHISLKADGISVFSGKGAAASSAHDYLFAENNGGTAVNYAKVKFYGAKIYTQYSTLARSYVPCYDTVNHVHGLWDEVEGAFYPSATATAFEGPHAAPQARVDGTRTWTGGAEDSIWESDANWDPDGAPLAAEDVVINAINGPVSFTCAGTPAAPASGMKTYTFTAMNGNSIYTEDRYFSANSDHVTFAFNALGGSITLALGSSSPKPGNNLEKGVLKAVITDNGSIKINSIGTPSAGSVITNLNGVLKTNWAIPLTANVTSYLAGTNSYLRPSGGGANIAAAHSMTIVADPARPADFGYIQCTSTGSNAKMTIASGFNPTVDVSAFAHVSGVYTNTFASFEVDAGSAMKVPTATVVGEGSENCTVQFVKASGTLMYMVITSANEEIPAPVIETGSEGGAAIEVRNGSFNVRVTNAARGYRYGYRKATELGGEWSEIIPLGEAHDTDASEKVLEIQVEADEPSCFYKIVVW